mmetsp:Transcript_65/g.135  ORF Transcript_65/g.135 Transcript_65/m.135 type:complete len:202 (-) Transcript_65:287-892(-)
MSASMSHYTTTLADALCGGSSRKLIAGWWYSVLALTAILILMTVPVMSTRTAGETFASVWSAVLSFILCIGGTMIMRKFHNSMAVGFFMGGVVAMAQLFFMLFLVYIGYAKDQVAAEESAKEERFMSFLCLIQSVLLGSFAAILGAHRAEILDKPLSEKSVMSGVSEGMSTFNYSGDYSETSTAADESLEPGYRAPESTRV